MWEGGGQTRKHRVSQYILFSLEIKFWQFVSFKSTYVHTSLFCLNISLRTIISGYVIYLQIHIVKFELKFTYDKSLNIFFKVDRKLNLFSENTEHICWSILNFISLSLSHSNFSHSERTKLVKIVALWFWRGSVLTIIPRQRTQQGSYRCNLCITPFASVTSLCYGTEGSANFSGPP